jgi:hypothetical protein
MFVNRCAREEVLIVKSVNRRTPRLHEAPTVSSRAAPFRSFAVAALLFSTACAGLTTGQYRSWTAGIIGCPAEEVSITDQKNIVWGGQGVDWRAECRGHRYICSQSGTAQCKEELRPAPPAAPALVPVAAKGS